MDRGEKGREREGERDTQKGRGLKSQLTIPRDVTHHTKCCAFEQNSVFFNG